MRDDEYWNFVEDDGAGLETLNEPVTGLRVLTVISLLWFVFYLAAS